MSARSLRGLGPTRPGVDPGKTFPSDGSAAVVGPVAVLVNGKPAEVLGAVGYPGVTDGYQVNFRLPPDATGASASIQLSAAWIAGPEINIPIKQQPALLPSLTNGHALAQLLEPFRHHLQFCSGPRAPAL